MISVATLIPRLETALEFAKQQVRATVERSPGFYPMYTRQGSRYVEEGEPVQ